MRDFKVELDNLWLSIFNDIKSLSPNLQHQLKLVQVRSSFLINAFANDEITAEEYKLQTIELDKEVKKLMTRLLAESTSLTSV